jgi:hypothetical protein
MVFYKGANAKPLIAARSLQCGAEQYYSDTTLPCRARLTSKLAIETDLEVLPLLQRPTPWSAYFEIAFDVNN